MKKHVVTMQTNPLPQHSPGMNLTAKLKLIGAAIAAIAAPSLGAADITWLPGTDGNWDVPANWQGGVLPVADDSVLIDSGTVTINTTVVIGVTGTSGASNTFAISNTAGDQSALIIANGGHLVTSNTFFSVGGNGNGYLEIQSGGTLQTGGYIYGNHIGRGANASGTAIIRSGGVWDSYGGVYVGGNEGGSGYLHVETGGTLTIAAGASLYVGEYAAGSGTAVIDGYFESGKNASGNPVYQPIGKNSTTNSTFILGATGTARTAGLEIGMSGNAVGTAIISGYWETVAAGWSRVGKDANSRGTLIVKDGGRLILTNGITVGTNANSIGYLEVEQGGLIHYSNNKNLYLGDAGSSSGTAVISGTISNMNTLYVGNNSNNTNMLIINQGGYVDNTANSWFGRNNGSPSGTNIANVDGTWLTGGYINAYYSTYVLNIGPTGIVKAAEAGTGIRFGGVANVAGFNSSGTIIVAGLLEATNGPVAVGYQRSTVSGVQSAKATMTILASGTVLAGSSTSSGESSLGAMGLGSGVNTIENAKGIAHVYGVWLNNGKIDLSVGRSGDGILYLYDTGTVTNNNAYVGRYGNEVGPGIGEAYVEGVWLTRGSMYIAVNGEGHFELGSSGTVITEGSTYMASGQSYSVASATTAGFWEIGKNLEVGKVGTATLAINGTSTITAGGDYVQGTRTQLTVELRQGRRADTVDSNFTAPLLEIQGAATLSGTLYAYGNAINDIPEFEWDAEGKASASTLTGIPVFRANGGIAGDFDTIEIDGLPIPPGLPDFIRGGGLKVNEGGTVDTRYDVGYGLAWKSGVTSAHGSFTVETGKSFEVDIQLFDRPLDFTSGWDGKSLVKDGDGTLILSVENSYTGVTTINGGDLIFMGPNKHTINDLVNNSIVDLGGSGQRLLAATSLAGSGTYRMVVDLSAGTGDQVTISGDAEGTHHFVVTGSGFDPTYKPTGNESDITILSIGGVNAVTYSTDVTLDGITINDNKFDYGVFKYEIGMQGNNLVIANAGMDDTVLGALKGVAGAQSVLWFGQQDNVATRFGELRSSRENGMGLDIWARGYAASLTLGGGGTEMRKSDVDMWSTEIGADYTWKFDTDRITAGAFIGYSSADQDFRAVPYSNGASGDSDMLSFGAYAAWMSASGWFANAVITVSHYKNKFNSTDVNYDRYFGDYKDYSFGATIEGGRRFDVANGWFIEPSLQGSAFHFNRGGDTIVSTHPDIANGLSMHGASATITRLRGTMRVGRAWALGNGQWLELVARGGAVRERSSGGEVNIGRDRWRPNLDGERFEAGLSAYWRPFERGQFYLDYEYTGGDCYQKPWGVSIGLRLAL